MNTPTTLPNTRTEQHLRAMALRAQLLALDAQAEALRSMDREHSLGVESSFSIECVRTDVHDFMNDVFNVVRKSSEVAIDQLRGSIGVLAERAKQLKQEGDKLKDRGLNAAKFRYATSCPDACGTVVAAPGASPVDGAAGPVPQAGVTVPASTEKLQAKADFACLRAEVDEYAAYAMQVHALCNLALEYCFTAAADAARCQSNV